MSNTSGELRIERGLSSCQVFQRERDNHADVICSGTSTGAGHIEARVLHQGESLHGYDWTVVGTARDGRWQATLSRLPAGGEYRIELRRIDETGQIAEAAAVDSVLVGDLWLLGGQSNMQGIGDMENVETPSELVHVYEFAERWAIAEEPLHRLEYSPHRVHAPGPPPAGPYQIPAKGAGLGLPFAKAYVQRTGVPVGLIPVAHGGTSMSQWDPALRDRGGDSLYGSMLLRVSAAGGRVTGLLWYQGESDAKRDAAPLFLERFVSFAQALRTDLGQPDLPILYVQIGRVVGWDDCQGWNAIQEAQRLAEQRIPVSAMAAAVDLELDDAIHIGTEGLKTLGRRLDVLAQCVIDRTPGIRRGPRPVALERVADGLRVRFAEVNGALRPATHIAGFILTDAEGNPGKPIIDASVDRRDPTVVRLLTADGNLTGQQLWYGFGCNSYCNLVDDLNMAAPVFGPWAIE